MNAIFFAVGGCGQFSWTHRRHLSLTSHFGNLRGLFCNVSCVGTRTPLRRLTIRARVRGRDPAAGAVAARRRRPKSAPQAEKFLGLGTPKPLKLDSIWCRPRTCDCRPIATRSLVLPLDLLPPAAPAASAMAVAVPAASRPCFWHARHAMSGLIERVNA